MCMHPRERERMSMPCVKVCVCACLRLSTTDNPANESNAQCHTAAFGSGVEKKTVVNTAALKYRDVHVNPFSRQTSNRV